MQYVNPKDFLSNLAYRYNIVQTVKKETDLFLASDFNLFNYIPTNEIMLSKIIAELLDPEGPHGQQDLFLRKLLDMLDRKYAYSSGYKVIIKTEKGTRFYDHEEIYDGRIDIHVSIESADRKYGIAIENKPWAGDQPLQIKRYLSEMKEAYKAPKDDYVLIYLSQGQKPPIHSISPEELAENSDNIVLWSYKIDIKTWLESCCAECKADRIRCFLNDFIAFVDRNFSVYEEGKQDGTN